MWEVGWSLETVLLHQVEVITLVEDLAAHTGIQTTERSYLAVLLGDELLAHRGDLDEEVIVGKVEIGSEVLVGTPLAVPRDRKCSRLVFPGNSVKIKERSELALAVVSKLMRNRSEASANLVEGLESQEPSAARWTSRSG